MLLSNFSERIYNLPLSELSNKKALISCLNAYSFNIAQKDLEFQCALQKSDVILPDGIAVVFAMRFLTGQKLTKIAGLTLFLHEMEQLNARSGRCFFLGSSESTNNLIRSRVGIEYPNVIMDSYSPPYKDIFSNEDNQRMLDEVNFFKPDVLFVGMTAPKQEKWAALNFELLDTKHVCCIGAVFNFYAGNTKCPPAWMINLGMEWLFRLLSEPRRLWRRYLLGNPRFIALILVEKMKLIKFRFPKFSET